MSSAEETPTSPEEQAGKAVLKVGDQEWDEERVKDLLKQKEELEQYRRYGRRLMLSDGTFDQEREEAVRALMADAQFEPEVIEEYIEAQKQPEEPEAAEPEVTVQEKSQPKKEVEVGDLAQEQGREEIEMLRQRLEQMEREVGGEKTRRIEQELESAVKGALDGNKDLATVLERSREVNGAESDGARREYFLDEVRRQTAENLRRRKASGGTYRPEWLVEEAGKAATVVAERIRSVIGDPSQLGRAPETVAGADEFVRRDPPKKPQFQKGEGSPEVLEKARAYTEGTLLNLAQEVEQGGESRA